MIVRRQTRLSLKPAELEKDPESQAYRCLFKVLEAGVSAEDASADTIKKCLLSFNRLSESLKPGTSKQGITRLFSE